MKGIAVSERFSSSEINAYVRHVSSCLTNIYPEYEKNKQTKSRPIPWQVRQLKD